MICVEKVFQGALLESMWAISGELSVAVVRS